MSIKLDRSELPDMVTSAIAEKMAVILIENPDAMFAGHRWAMKTAGGEMVLYAAPEGPHRPSYRWDCYRDPFVDTWWSLKEAHDQRVKDRRDRARDARNAVACSAISIDLDLWERHGDGYRLTGGAS